MQRLYVLRLIGFLLFVRLISLPALCHAMTFKCHGYQIDPLKRSTSQPYISGDTFRAAADFIIDETAIPFEADSVKKGDKIFVNGDLLEEFFRQCHPLIRCSYILISHNSDEAITDKFLCYLEDKKLIAWFGKNVTVKHPKLVPIPIGIANNFWPHGDTRVFDHLVSLRKRNNEKKYLLYMNFEKNTYIRERLKVQNIFANKDFCFKSSRKDMLSYLIDISDSKFVLSPRGNGLDCHRTWEALLIGSIPIIKSSQLDYLYSDLPVLIVSDWTEVTEEFLETKYKEISSKKYNWDKIYASHWLTKINDLSQMAKQEFESVGFDESMSVSCCYEIENCIHKFEWDILKKLYNTNFLTNICVPEYLRIPKIIHWIWLGSEIPEKYKKIQESWKKYNPDWEFRLWTDQDVATFKLTNQRAFDKAINWGEKSDIFRYEILFRYGGLYVDVDFECLKSFDMLHRICDFYAGIAYDKRPLLYNGLIGAKAGHPILAECIKYVDASGTNDAEQIMQKSGPYFFSKIFFNMLRACSDSVILPLPVTYLYPLPNTLRHEGSTFELNQVKKYVKPESFAIHYWGTSWIR